MTVLGAKMIVKVRSMDGLVLVELMKQLLFVSKFVMMENLLDEKLVTMGKLMIGDVKTLVLESEKVGIVQKEQRTQLQFAVQSVETVLLLEKNHVMTVFWGMNKDARMIVLGLCLVGIVQVGTKKLQQIVL